MSESIEKIKINKKEIGEEVTEEEVEGEEGEEGEKVEGEKISEEEIKEQEAEIRTQDAEDLAGARKLIQEILRESEKLREEAQVTERAEEEDARETARKVIELQITTINERAKGLAPKEREEYIRRQTGNETKEEAIENLTKNLLRGREEQKKEDLDRQREGEMKETKEVIEAMDRLEEDKRNYEKILKNYKEETKKMAEEGITDKVERGEKLNPKEQTAWLVWERLRNTKNFFERSGKMTEETMEMIDKEVTENLKV